MGIKIDGLDDLSKKLKQMEKAAKELDGTHQIPMIELFTNSFMSKYTSFHSFDELLESGGFVVNTQADFEAIPDEIFDQHIAKYTKFSSWQDMMTQAGKEYALKKLGF